MSAPTIYFPVTPQSGLYEIGWAPGRTYDTMIAEGPTGTKQARAVRAARKVWHKLTVQCRDTTNNMPDNALFLTMRNFEASIMGRANPFWIFDPLPQVFNYAITLTYAGGVATNLPIVLPFIGGSFALLGTSGTDFDQGGPGGEYRLVTYPPVLSDGDHVVTLFGDDPAYVRYAVRKTHDSDDWSLNPNAAAPPVRITMDIEQDIYIP